MKKLLLGISSGVMFTLLSMAISLITVPYFLEFLTREEFGLFYLMNNIIIWAGLANVGLRGSFKLQLARAVGKGEPTEALTSTYFFTQTFIAIVVSVLGMCISFFADTFFTNPETSASDIQSVFILLVICFGFSLISNCLASILSVQNKDFAVYSVRCIFSVLQALISIILLNRGFGISGLAIAALLIELLFFLYVLFLVKIMFAHASLNLSLFNTKVLSSSLSIGKWFLLGFFAQLLIKHSDLLLIGELSGIDQVTAFLITSKLYVLASGFLQMLLKITTPQLIRWTCTEKSQDQLNMHLLFIKCFVGFSVLAGCGIYVYNETFVNWWLGSSYYLGQDINFLLLLAFLFGSFTMVARSLLLAKHELRLQKISALSEGILHISLSLTLGFFFDLHGIVAGIAFSSFMSCIITFLPLMVITPSSFSKENRASNLLMFYVLLSLAIIFSIYLSPHYFGKEIISLSIVALLFLVMFLEDLRSIADIVLRYDRLWKH